MTSPLADNTELNVVTEFGKNLFKGFSENIGKNIEATTVGHPQHDLPDAILPRLLNQGVEKGDDDFPAFQGKTFLADEFLVQEFFKQDRFLEFSENADFLFFENPVRLRVFSIRS